MLKINPTSAGSGPSPIAIGLVFSLLAFFWYLYTFDSELRRFLADNIIHSTVYSSLFIIIAYMTFQKSYRVRNTDTLTEKEIDDLVHEWMPKPLFPTPTEQQLLDMQIPIVERVTSTTATYEGQELIDMTTLNLLGLAQNDEIKEAAVSAVEKYSVGSCGPRGFYGTMNVHLEAEDIASEFIGSEGAVFYSSSLAMLTSVIPFLLKLGDFIICDDGVRHCVQIGNLLSKSKVCYFKHNDMAHLKEVASHVTREMHGAAVRCFIIVEGIYFNSGDICPLPEVVRVAKQHKFRLLLDDSFAFGVLGRTGRGTWEHFGVPLEEIDMLLFEAGAAIASVGGFALSHWRLADEQHFSGSGFVYSASQPPYLAASAIKSIELLRAQPERFLQPLHRNVRHLRQNLTGIEPLVAIGSEESPIIHLRLLPQIGGSRYEQNVILQRFVDAARSRGVLLTRAKYTNTQRLLPEPSIRLVVNADHTIEQLDQVVAAIRSVVAEEKSEK